MSTKDFFNKSNSFISNTNDKASYDLVESSRNVRSTREKEKQYVPHVDFSDAGNFCFYGSAELYYKSAISRIYDFYPYDGSRDEKNKFFTNSFDIDKYFFDNLYPKTNGYVRLSDSYITIKGGPNTITSANTKGLFGKEGSQNKTLSNIYSEDIYAFEGLESDFGEGSRESNLKTDLSNGVTVEFWLKSDSLASNELQTIFHLTDSSGKNELSIYLSGTSDCPFHVTVAGGTGASIYSNSKVQIADSTITTGSLTSFKHYALAFISSSSEQKVKLYCNGKLNGAAELRSGPIPAFNQDGLKAYIGSGSEGSLLSASIDEFRFWKTQRNAEQIGLNWFAPVDGGTNSDIANTTLGIYYKFNEGKTGTQSQDQVVLDYSGRLSNGTFTGYSANYTRVTSSALVESGLVDSEEKDPIIYSNHPDVVSLYNDYVNRGKVFDYGNNTSFINYLPSWVIEEHEDLENKNLKYISHIVGSYFDYLFLRINDIESIKTNVYPGDKEKPVTYAQALPASLGLDTPELFVDADILETIKSRNKDKLFTDKLENTKNLIYSNLYSNLAKIYKSKGTKSSIRNTLRALGVPENIVTFTTYTNNVIFDLEDKRTQQTINKKFVNFNSETNSKSVLYISGSGISGSGENGYEDTYGVSYEAELFFPYFDSRIKTFNRDFTTSSIMGVCHKTGSGTEIGDSSFFVTFERNSKSSRSGKFVLRTSGSLASTVLTSSNFVDVYDNKNWLISLRVKPNGYPSNLSVSGATKTPYTIQFTGYQVELDTIVDSFDLTTTSSESALTGFLTSSKQVFVGARRDNITGSTVSQKADYLVSSVRGWNKYISNNDLISHARDFENVGIEDYFDNVNPIDSNVKNVKNKDTLVFNWMFNDITTSDSSGEFTSLDASSGSSPVSSKLALSSYGAHNCQAEHFPASSTSVLSHKKINVMNQVDLGSSISDDQVKILTTDDELFEAKDIIPNYHYFLEKSMYKSISAEMMNLFSGIVDFNNVIGQYQNTYRMEYKELSKLREIFFEKVTEVTEVEKFISYYKWFDDAISTIITQLLPASSDFTPDLINTIEPHALERDKYQHRLPMLEFTSSTEGVVFGAEEARYNWRTGHAPVSGQQSQNARWWRERAERTGILNSGDSAFDVARENVKIISTNRNNRNAPRSVKTDGTIYRPSAFKYRTISKNVIVDKSISREIKGGVNFEHNKNIHYTYASLHPAGPINTDNGVFVPRNVLLGYTEDLVALQDIDDFSTNPAKKVKRNLLVQHGRDWEDGIGYKNVKSQIVFPFNIISSSVVSGHNAEVVSRVTASVEVTNLHNDVYGPDMERPVQGPFTEHVVGGHQSRHIKLNTGNDNYLNRPEAWKLALGLCAGTTGAIGMVGADYPYPEGNAIGKTPYPMTGAQKATYFRDELAKRPVNIRNIEHKTGSTILGNYNQNYEVVHSVGGYSNPRAFIDEQPNLPSAAKGADFVRTILDIDRGKDGHHVFVDDYGIGYLTGSANYKNKTVIVSRFSAPGSNESMTAGYKDFRAGEFSVYNTIPFRNMTVRRPFQGVSSSISTINLGVRSFDHTGRAFGLTNLSARHATRFFRDSTIVPDTEHSNVPRNNFTPSVTAPGGTDDAIVQSPSFHKIHRNNLLKADSDTTCRQIYDNLNIQSQIPRSDRQYSWIAHSIVHTGACEPRYSGFMLTDSPVAPYYEITGNYYPFFDYVTASVIVSGTYQNTTRINLLTRDKVDSQNNTLGSSPIPRSSLVNVPVGQQLNSLLIHRGDTYGWGWRALRQKDHPVLLHEHKNRTLTVQKGDGLKEFRLPPVSLKGRIGVANLDSGGQNISIEVTNNNEKIYFNERELNDLVFPVKDPTMTELDQVIDIGQQDNSQLNWLLHTENIFPSMRNEGVSGSRERVGFDNEFWRGSNSERVALASSGGATNPNQGLNSLQSDHSQSSWPLEEPAKFLTRTTIPDVNTSTNHIAISSSAGELQNEYVMAPSDPSLHNIYKLGQRKIGALYSRKQYMTSPNSVVSRTGFAPTGSLTGSFTQQIQQFGGEAKWEADVNAVIQIKSGSSFVTSSSPSNPWFNTYDDYKEDLMLLARGYGVVPEFRISEHVNDYYTAGLFNKTKQDELEIVGTQFSSADQNFYKDYSNSDFLKEFSEIKDKSQMTGSEIMLSCKAAIRFNPYKGFYPAQRTLDLVSQFSKSFKKGIVQMYKSGTVDTLVPFSPNGAPGIRPLIQPLFAPGILYNSIKSGISVDYPIVNIDSKFESVNFDNSQAGTENYCLIPLSSGSFLFTPRGRYNPDDGAFWDQRIPFEAIINPGKFIDKATFIDFEPNPSSSAQSFSASLDTSVSDGVYSLMAKNFFGQTGEFFLKNESFTKISSDLIQDGLKFSSGDVYGARLKIRKSHNGKRFYNQEYDYVGNTGSTSFFSKLGARSTSGQFSGSAIGLLSGSFPIPQDPAHNSNFQETFTMYSRPTAFGPAIAGRNSSSGYENAFLSGTLDSIEGYNWSYTPPYYHGESWVDFIFRPEAGKEYTLEDILSEIETVYWRVDPGEPTGSFSPSGSFAWKNDRTLINTNFQITGIGSGRVPIYGGSVLNDNAMQISSSVNLFGVERVPKKRKDKFGNTILSQNELAGKRWVIQPKWETPMLNFAKVKSGSGVTYPTNFSESVPRGMWHQFGEIPNDPNTGIFLEIDDISQDWLKNHYQVVKYSSSYNNNEPTTSGSTAYKDFKSLTDLFGFNRSEKKDAGKVRLGELADKREIYEAIVAIPYIIEAKDNYSDVSSNDDINRKKFVGISKERFNASLKEQEGSATGDSLDIAGQSIREMVQKMKRYVLPPQFDFINFSELEPFVMYFFEFKYELDRDDLSYIWQNLAPRDYKKITFQESRNAHKLMDNELLNEPDIMNSENLRWMVFKVKQKAKSDYYDLVPTQTNAARQISILDKNDTDKDDEYLRFNWPYDYVSFVELINLDVSVLYKNEEE